MSARAAETVGQHRYPSALLVERALSEQDVEAIACRVVELLIASPTASAKYIDTAAVAEMLNVSEDWVRAHAAELGGVRAGDGARGALRFRAHRVMAAMERRHLARPECSPTPRRPGPRRASRSVRMLPLPDEAAP